MAYKNLHHLKIIIITIMICMNFSLADGKTKLDEAFKYLKEYDKTRRFWWRHDFEKSLTEAATEGDPEAQYWYYQFATYVMSNFATSNSEK